MSAQSQTALALTEIGKPLAQISLPIPDQSTLKDHEVLVKITAAGLAPLDQKLRDMGILGIDSRLPAVISGDIVGAVVKNGPESSFPIRSHIFSQALFHLSTGGGLQEYTVLNSLYAGVVPAGVDDTEAALYPINAVTSGMALFSPAGFNLPLPETPKAAAVNYESLKIAIIGGGTNTGRLAIQFARLAGFGVIIAIASSSGAEVLQGLGATHVIACQDTDVEEQVRRIASDDLTYVYDTFTFGDLTLGVSLLSNSKKGAFVYNGEGQIDEAVLASKRGGIDAKRILGFSHFIPDFGQEFWKVFPGWLETGKIVPLKYNVIEGLDADKVNEALDDYSQGKSGERYHVRL